MTYGTDARALEFITLFEDSDISRFPEIQDAEEGVYLAALLLLAKSLDDGDEPSENDVVRAVGAHMGYFLDESALSSGTKIMDLAEGYPLRQGTLDRLIEDVARGELKKYRDRGNHVVELRETRGWDPSISGFYIFTKNAV